MKETRIITAALPFANAIPHLGNIVGSHLPADIFARFCRLRKYRTFLIGGMDEHGTAIEIAAQQAKKTPKKLCNELYKVHKEIYDWFGIDYDNFSQTSREVHHDLVKKFAEILHKKGYIKEKEIATPYCPRCRRGLADRYITGVCPHCGYESAHGDQCEKCGRVLMSADLKQPFCSVCRSDKIEFKKTKHLFLDLRQVVSRIEEWLDANANLRPQVKNQAKGWLKTGLKERCISRDLKWGVQIPIKGYKDKVFYVWFDNVVGYVSSTIELLGREGGKLWRDKETKVYHFLGKDNIIFHTIFWPGAIIASGEFILPHNVVGLQFLNYEGQKFSKSKGVGIFGDQLLKSDIPVDYWRFYLASVIPETRDTEFLADEFVSKINSELIGNFGNLVNRTLHLVNRQLKGKAPQIVVDEDAEKQINHCVKKAVDAYEKCEFRNALKWILSLTDFGNKYLEQKQPWKTNDANALAYCCEVCRLASVLISPIIINGSAKILDLLNSRDDKLEISRNEKSVKKPEIVFTKLEADALASFKQLTSL